jgi:tetratricopeptide (TPR) repeat protein
VAVDLSASSEDEPGAAPPPLAAGSAHRARRLTQALLRPARGTVAVGRHPLRSARRLSRLPRRAVRVIALQPGRALLLVGVVLLAAGLVLPWLDIPLQAPVHSTSISVDLPGLAAPASHAGLGGPLTYGAGLCLLLVVAVVAGAARRGRPGAVVGATGLVGVFLSFAFPLLVVNADQPLLAHLEQSVAQFQTITKQFDYSVGSLPLTALGLHALKGQAQDVASALRLGWYASLVGSTLLGAAGGPSLRRRFSRRAGSPPVSPWAVVPVILTSAVLALTGVEAGRGVAATHLVREAATALELGESNVAASRLSTAQRLDPTVLENTPSALIAGQVALAEGNTADPLALTSQAEALASAPAPSGQAEQLAAAQALVELRQAEAAAPHNAVVITEERALVISTAEAGHNLALVQQALSDPHLSDLSLRYTYARMAFAAGQDDVTINQMEQVLTQTADQDVKSSAATYISLSLQAEGRFDQARTWLATALADDPGDYNTLARTEATGLYQSIQP